MHMLRKKDLSSGELETLKRSGSPITVVTVNGEVQTNEEAQVYVHDLHISTLCSCLRMLLPYVWSLGKLCKEHGYTCEWPSGCEPRLTQNGNQTLCRHENFVPLVVPGLSSSCTATSSSTSPSQDPSISLEPANEFGLDSGASMHPLSKKGFKLSRTGHA